MADDPELEKIVQSMIDAGESEQDIAGVIKHYDESKLPPYKGPDTYWGGVKKSLTSGEALGAGLEGAKGWVKGALDIPGSISGALGTIGNLVSDPVGTIGSIPEGLSNMWETTKRAGSEPEAFGQMTGQLTGQPLVTHGIVKAAPPVMRTAAPGVQAVGRVMQDYQPLSGLIPNMARMRTAGLAERLAGRGIENIGKRMGRRTVQGEVVEPPVTFTEGQIIPPEPPTPMPSHTQVPAPMPQGQLPAPVPPGLPPGAPPPRTLSSVTEVPRTYPEPPPGPKLFPPVKEKIYSEPPKRKMIEAPMESEAKSPTPETKRVFDKRKRRFEELKAKNKKKNLTPEEYKEGFELRAWLAGKE